MGSMHLRAALILTAFFCGTAGAACFPGSMRGVTVSTHRSGQEWGSDHMRPTMEELRDLGVEWIAIHPYAGIRADGSVRVFGGLDPGVPPQELVRPIREAHALGLKILIKPHLAYWGSPFTWRGEIAFDDEASWARFWSGYREWILTLAKISAEADGFVVGTELDRTLDQGERWVDLIRAVRQVNPAPLTYAANWDSYEKVTFWHELNAIGIQAYFPLVAADAETTEAAIRDGWSTWTTKLAAYGKAQGRPVLFTELGYNDSTTTAREPWSSQSDEGGEATQALCTRVALETVEREDTIVGAFLWKWFPGPYPAGRNFRLATPTMRGVIHDAWGKNHPK